MSCDLVRPHDQKVEYNYGKEPLRVSHHLVKFDGLTHCDAEMFLVCHMISKDHLTKMYSNIMGKSQGRLVTILPGLIIMGLW